MADDRIPESVLSRAAQGDDAALFALAEARQRGWDLAGAEALLQAALALPVDRARVHFQLSILAMQQGFADQAFAQAARAEALAPRSRAIRHHALTLEKLREPQDPAAFLAAHRRFGADFADQEANLHPRAPRTLAPGRPLRVAYVTPDAHMAMARFVGCLYRGHDPASIEARFYHAFADAEALAALPGRHVALAGLDDAQVAERLLRDAPDIVVDLAGHGAGNQLFALMRRPAPVQLTWLDYVATTGVPALDGRIGDGWTDPEGSERWSSETPLRLEVSPWCYEPHPAAPPLRATPPAEGAPLRLGACCVPLKLGDGVLATWRALLEALPGSELVLLGLPEGRARERVRAAFAGIDPQRLRLEGRLALPDFYRAIDAFDIALDPFPFSGATATLDCLWQGVPVVTLPGLLPHSRSSASLLAQAGLEAWIAADRQHYIDVVRTLAQDGAARTAFRREARARLARTPLLDAARFVPALERGLRQAWHGYVASQLGPPEAARRAPDNHRAERRAREAQAAIPAGERTRAHTDLGMVLRQLPAWTEVRRAWWAGVPRVAAPPADAARDALARIALVRMGEGEGPLPDWADACASVQRIAWPEAAPGSACAALAARCDAEFLLFAPAAAALWLLAGPKLGAWLDAADLIGGLGETTADGGRRCIGSRLHRQDGRWFGRAWPQPLPAPVEALPDNLLLVRRDWLQQADAVSIGREAGAALRLRDWHACLSSALHARGARSLCASAVVAVEDLDAAADQAVAAWQHARLADAGTRARIDVGRVFGTPDAAMAQALLGGLFGRA
jgi:predicted O-linked N-acetylglucosamine transferase (SPINDLY family)